MSEDRTAPARLPKWPFYLADLLLSGVAFFVLYRLGVFEGTSEMVVAGLALAAAAVAAWISIVPWLREHQASVRLAENTSLKSSLEQIQSLEKVAELIRQSNSQWQSIQDASARTMNSAREITDRMKIESEEFIKVMDQAHDQERAGLRLEVEKLRRMEADWIKVVVQILDQVYALTRAAERSGQQQIISQLTQFQNVCRDVARRLGLAAFSPVPGQGFDARAHQLPDAQFTPPEDARVGEVLATGYTYQGQLLRRSLVLLAGSGPEPESQNAPETESIENPPAPSEPASSSEPGSASPDDPTSEAQASMGEPASEATPEVPGELRQESEPAAENDSNQEAMRPAKRSTRRTGQEELPL